MQEHPILFNTAMVKAILNGQKIQTRRPIKRQPNWPINASYTQYKDGELKIFANTGKECTKPILKFPHGRPGDLLWVRETHALIPNKEYKGLNGRINPEDKDLMAIYKEALLDTEKSSLIKNITWRPSIHMPYWACRIKLLIVNTHIERIQEINSGGAIKEGFDSPNALKKYKEVWNKTYKNWDQNPWVWVLEFKLIQ